MKDSQSKTAAIEPAPATSELPQLNPVDVFFALGSEVRWPIIKLLADGRARSISEIRPVTGTTAENVSKQLRMMLAAGVVVNRPAEDRRQSVFAIPAACLATPGVLDFGFCVVKFDNA